MANIAPIDYERNLALYGPPPTSVTEQTGASRSRRLTEPASPVSPDVSRNDTYSMSGTKMRPGLLPTRNGMTRHGPAPRYPFNDRNPTELSWLVEIANGAGDWEGEIGKPSPREVADLYAARSEASTGTTRRFG